MRSPRYATGRRTPVAWVEAEMGAKVRAQVRVGGGRIKVKERKV